MVKRSFNLKINNIKIFKNLRELTFTVNCLDLSITTGTEACNDVRTAHLRTDVLLFNK